MSSFWLREGALSAGRFRYAPNAGHRALAALCGALPESVFVVTQNIDGLHRHPEARVPPERLVEVHGAHDAFRCLSGACEYGSRRVVRVEAPVESLAAVPRCPACSRVMVPLALLFDEPYEAHEAFQFARAQAWFQDASVFVFVGTSYAVHVTDVAFSAALRRAERVDGGASGVGAGARVFDFNLSAEAVPRRKRMSRVRVDCVVGRAEETLPALAERVLLQLARASLAARPPSPS